MSSLFGYWTLYDQNDYLNDVGHFQDMIQNDTLQFNGTHAFYTYTVVQGEPLITAILLFIAVCIGIMCALRIYYFVKGDAN